MKCLKVGVPGNNAKKGSNKRSIEQMVETQYKYLADELKL